MRYFQTIIVFILSLGVIVFSEGSGTFSIYAIFTLLMCVSVKELYNNRHMPFSLQKMFFIFWLFFISIAPVAQFKKNVRIWGGVPLTEWDYVYAGVILLIVLLIYNIVYNNNISRGSKPLSILLYCETIKIRYKKPTIIFNLILITICSLITLSYFWFCDFNPYLIFFRVEDLMSDNSQQISPIQSLIFGATIRPLNLIIFCIYKMIYPKENKVAVIIFLLGLLAMFPTGTSRASAAAVYIPVVLVSIPLLRKRWVFVNVMMAAVFVIWPFLTLFRNSEKLEEGKFVIDTSLFTAGDMDAFSSFARVLKFDIITYGYQLLGNFLFFVPRSIWADKPEGSSFLLSKICNLDLDNISCLYFAEGYINFGLIGVFLFTYVLARVSAALDRFYWIKCYSSALFSIIYFVCIGFIFLILRGDLLSSVSYFIGMCVCIYLVSLIFYKK